MHTLQNESDARDIAEAMAIDGTYSVYIYEIVSHTEVEIMYNMIEDRDTRQVKKLTKTVKEAASELDAQDRKGKENPK